MLPHTARSTLVPDSSAIAARLVHHAPLAVPAPLGPASGAVRSVATDPHHGCVDWYHYELHDSAEQPGLLRAHSGRR